MARQFIDDDFVAVREQASAGSRRLVTLAFGDPIEILQTDSWSRVRVLSHFDGPFEGFVKGAPPVRDKGVLNLSFVDVQQGDGLILETPEGKILFIDGGDNKLFARHAAARFRHRGATADQPLEVEAIIVTHGDADHFDGLNDIRRSESLPRHKAHKKLFIHPKRVYHNGLVKGPGEDANGKRVKDVDRFGRTVQDGENRLIVDLYDDPREADESRMNQPFKRWKQTLDHWESRGPIELKRIAFGMNEAELFDFLHEEGIRVELQGPFTTEESGSGTGDSVPALPFFHKPKRSAEIHLEQGGAGGGGLSASHTINGHSIAFRLVYGNVRFSFTGDLNQESMNEMLTRLGPDELEAEIIKAPHHGSHDFDFGALEAMRPVVACVSSGDESVFKEHIHPRATLLAALGAVMRGKTGLVLSTELAAFFAKKDYCYRRADLASFFKDNANEEYTGEELRRLFSGVPRPEEDPPGLFFGFERKNFGIIHVRTDGERVLVFTHSGKKGLNEAYRFVVTIENGERKIDFADAVVTR